MTGEPKGTAAIAEEHKPGNHIQNLANHYDDHAVTLLDQITVNFSLRQNKTLQCLSTLESLPNYDQQIQSALNYLALHPDTAEDLSQELLENAQQGIGSEAETFAAALVALHNGNKNWIEQVFNGFLPFEDYRDGLAYALAWLPIKTSTPWVKAFLRSKDLNHKYLGVRVCSLLNEYPQDTIRALAQREDCQQNLLLYKALLFLGGQMKDSKLHPQLVQASSHDDPNLVSTALQARLMQGDTSVKKEAMSHSLQSSECFHQISQWLIRSMTIQESRHYLSLAFKNTAITMDIKILAMAAHGDPSVITWMLQNIQAPSLIPWLGLAFYKITGLDITQPHLDLIVKNEDELEALHEDDEEPIFLEGDLSLPYPKREKLLALWRNMQAGFNKQDRYFLGNIMNLSKVDLPHTNNRTYGFIRNNAAIYNSLYNSKTFYSTFILPQV